MSLPKSYSFRLDLLDVPLLLHLDHFMKIQTSACSNANWLFVDIVVSSTRPCRWQCWWLQSCTTSGHGTVFVFFSWCTWKETASHTVCAILDGTWYSLIFDIWYVSWYDILCKLYDLGYVFYDSCYNAYNIFKIHIRTLSNWKKPSVKWNKCIIRCSTCVNYTLHEITSLRIFCTIPQMKMFKNAWARNLLC